MDDLISRQGAIDALKNCEPGEELFMIESLPSAQPDEDMIHLQKEQAYMQGWEEGRRALREELWGDARKSLDR